MSQNKIANYSEKNDYDSQRGDIDIVFVLSIIYKDKFLILFLSFFFAVCAYGISLAFPNKYKATVILAPAQKDSGGPLGGLASQYGGLAAMAGISLGKESDKTDQAIALLKSWPFLDFVISKYNLEADVLAVKGFNKKSQHVIYDVNLYNEKNRGWVVSKFRETDGKPSSWMLYKKFNKFLEVQSDKKSGLLTVSITHISPVIAKNWLELLIKEINLHFQLIDKEDAKRNIVYLEKKIAETSVAEMQSVFFGMVEAQTKVLMLTERSDDYLFKIVVRPMLPEEKNSPKRFVITIFGFFSGFLIWCCVALIRFYRLARLDISFETVAS
ncbi:MAG TPA: Wzz/FepE/Etk N-terminal domain-containing protein [Cellvibrionaceae bacterium]